MTQTVPSRPMSLSTLTPLLALAMCGCGNAPETDDLAEEANAEFAEQVGEALGTSEHCESPETIDKIFASSFPKPGFVSGSSYDNPDCRHAVVVDIKALDKSGPHNIVTHNETPPTSRSECEKLRLGVYVWAPIDDYPPSLWASAWRWGSWAGGRCTVPFIDVTAELGVDHKDKAYRITASARRQFTALDSTSDFNLRSIRFYRTN